MKLKDLKGDEFLKKGWDDLVGEHVQSWVESEENKWTAEQVGWVSNDDFWVGHFADK